MKRSQFRRLMDILLRTLGRQTRRTIAQYGVPVTDAQRVEVATALLPHIQRARLQSHALGVQLLEAQADGMGLQMPEVAPVRPYERQAVVTVLENVTRVEKPSRTGSSVTVTDDNEIPDDAPRVSVTVLDPVTRRDSRVTVEVTEDNRRDPEVVKVISDRVVSVAERHARMPSREAVTDTVESDEAEELGEVIGFARVLTGAESCGFCAMLASRGPTFTEKSTVGPVSREAASAFFVSSRSKRYDANELKAYHNNCDCEVVLVREGEDWPGMDQYDALERLWIDVTDGKRLSAEGARKAFAKRFREEVANGNGGRFVPDVD